MRPGRQGFDAPAPLGRRRRLLKVGRSGLFDVWDVDVLGTEQQRRALNSVPRAASRVLGSHGLSEGVRVAFAVAFGIVAIWLLVQVRRGADWVTAAGWATLALLLSTAWLLPWYGVWLMPLAALSSDRRLRVAAVAFTAVYLATKILPNLA